MSILITGGTGSFGQAFVRRLLLNGYDDRIIIYSRDEQKQERMASDLKSLDIKGHLRFFIGDVRDKERLKIAMRDADVIIHAAAMKIVPSAEYNPIECIKTNILGAQNIIELCSEGYYPGTRRVLALSTDKAVYPINLYGSTKHAMEKLFLAANAFSGRNAIYSVVRYGNVSGSRGSVIPLFRDRAERGQTIPVTHQLMTRFWITLDEASEFVYNRLGDMYPVEQGGNRIYIPKMRSYNIIDLARIYAQYKEEKVVYTGMRPGEKLHEDLITSYEISYLRASNKGYYEIGPTQVEDVVDFNINSLNAERISVTDLEKLLDKEGFLNA